MNIVSNIYDNTFYVEVNIKNNMQTTLQYNSKDHQVIKLTNLTIAAKSAYSSNQKVSIQSDSVPNIILYQS